jgi:hypothetical protein
MDFSPDGSRLAIGYGLGAIRILGVSARRLVHQWREAVQPGRGVIQVRYATRFVCGLDFICCLAA